MTASETPTTGATSGRLIVVTYDHEARASYQRVSDKPIAYTRENWPEIRDYAADGTLVGIERLY